jgi:geranylgeranyl diphosphate synthase type I
MTDVPVSKSFASLFEGFRSDLDADLRRQLRAKHQAMEELAPEVVRLVDALSDLVLRGGKRLRPALIHFGYRACGGTDLEAVRPLEMATELLHTYLLVHDDIMDNADVRRGAPAAHARFRNEHRRNGHRGDAEHYGASLATLVGNLAHAQAHEQFTKACDSASEKASLRETFSTMEREVIAGQLLEMQLAERQEATPEMLERVLQLKSGRYSVKRPLQLGSLFADAHDGQFESLSRYGRDAGGAFQLQDDLLGMFGDPEAMGKPVGDDLREGKFTYLVYHTLQQSDAEDQQLVQEALGDDSLTEEEVQRVCDIMRRSGALDRVRDMINERLTRARTALADTAFDAEGETFLHGFIDYLGERNK